MTKLLDLIEGMPQLPYFAKASFILFILYGIYLMFFSKGTHFFANRVFLIGTIVMTLVLPLISIKAYPIVVKMVAIPNNVATVFQGTKNEIDLFWILTTIYLFGISWMFYRFLRQLLQIYLCIQTSVKSKKDYVYFVEDSNYPISSFLNYIFLPNTEINPIMVEHERIHIDKQHTCDVLLASFFRCVFWFHPFSHAMIRSIKLNHEYECDALMVKRFTVEQYAQVLLSQAQSVRPNSVINQFYSFTKKRIIMLSHLQSNRKPNRNFIWMFPTFIMVFAMFSFKKYYVSIDNQNALVSATDSIPKGQQYVDTIIGMDPVTFKETITLIPKTYKITDTVEYLTTVDGTPCTSQLIASHEFPVEYYLRNIDNMVDAKDTIIVLDPETMQETIKISEYKISKLYKDMIDSELEKSEPNFKLIEKWTNEGKRNAGR